MQYHISPPTSLLSVVPTQCGCLTVECQNMVADMLVQRGELLSSTLKQLISATSIALAARLIVDVLQGGKKVLLAGNGGAAAAAQHFAAELVGRFQQDRHAYAAVALTADTATLTAVANDYGYQEVFARQVDGLGMPGDLLIALSVSGESENIIRAVQAAKERQLPVIGMTGKHVSRLARLADVAITIPVFNVPVVQELHLVIIHLLCDLVERELVLPSIAGSARKNYDLPGGNP